MTWGGDGGKGGTRGKVERHVARGRQGGMSKHVG